MKLQKATGAQMAQAGAATLSKGPRFTVSKGLMTVLVSTIVLFVLCAVIAPSSVSSGPLGSMIPFASILAIAGLGQMLVIQQAGIDLSVPSAISLAAVIVTKVPQGDDSKLVSAIFMALGVAILVGILTASLLGFLN